MTQEEYKSMAETGHARNIEHLNTMIAFVTGYGAAAVMLQAGDFL